MHAGSPSLHPRVHCTPGPLHSRVPASPQRALKGCEDLATHGCSGNEAGPRRWTPSASETDVHPTGITPGLNVVQPRPESRPATTLKEAPGGVFKVNAKRLLRILPSPRRVWSPIKSTFCFQEEVS
ncbi:unnamed protein product [Rangifer tarandus platyrhynchus]|uniref:Uncharacterized protein n=2 Tax=Rangifer tarandus platyrhynchus TaxID=3082113 RepID=A0ABN8ZFS1_RANTA|nr:unnamed protein product [Rangifer tarandus platyrhynchus]CAI9707917.1 unnamed protein product [Rangifer tarandus platyrhynchus]